MIHREALAAKKLELFVNKVLRDAISVINLIKSKPLNSRLLTILCNEMGSDRDFDNDSRVSAFRVSTSGLD